MYNHNFFVGLILVLLIAISAQLALSSFANSTLLTVFDFSAGFLVGYLLYERKR